MLVVLLVLMSLLTGRLVQLQVLEGADLAVIGEEQRSRSIELAARRGRLYDRDGAVLATSVDSATIIADPYAYVTRTLPDGRVQTPKVAVADAAASLAPYLGMDVADVREMLARESRFVYLGRRLDWEVGEAVMSLGLPGIVRVVEPRRVYPNGPLGAPLLGFTGAEGEGRHGLEQTFDEMLAGAPGRIAVEGAPQGLTIAAGAREVTPSSPGTDLVLTIDREIQQHAEAAALAAMEEYDAIGASVLVLEVGTGQVIAAASTPGFDARERGDDPEVWRNRAVTDVFEPGSVQKAVTIAAAIDEGLIDADTVFQVSDSITIGPKTFRDAHEHPTEAMTVSDIIATSSNVGTMMIADMLGDQRLHDRLISFGYGSQTGVGLPGESRGLLPAVADWSVTSRPTIAIGQGVAVTMLQAADAYATLGNGGVAVTPTILRGTVGPDGQLVPSAASDSWRVVKEDTARQVVEMLAGVIEDEGGTGALAAVPGYRVGGKTGTARKPGPGGYTDQYMATFVGLAPLENPKFVIAVMVDEPFPIFGGVVAAPLFSDVMEFTLRSRGIAPTSDSTDLDKLLADAAAIDPAASVMGSEVASEDPEEVRQSVDGDTTP